MMAIISRRFVPVAVTSFAVATAIAVGPIAAADSPGCLPLNGAQSTANSFNNTNYFGITYATNVDYWYADGAVNWHKTVDGGSLNTVHSDTTGTVPAAPGATVAIPGATAGEASSYRPSNDGAPLLVTVCTK